MNASSEGPPGALRLWHMPGSRSTRPLWLWHELQELYSGLPELQVQRLDPAAFRVQKPRWFLQRNPNGKVPLLEDTASGRSMWDSGAISLALLDRFDTRGLLAPRDAEWRERFYRLAFYASGTLDNLGAMSSPVQRVMASPTPGEEPALVETNFRAWREVCGPLLCEELRQGGDFLHRSGFSALDVFVGVPLIFLHRRRWLSHFPRVQDYYHRIRARPAFRRAAEGATGIRDPYNDDPLPPPAHGGAAPRL
eukprot:TRINITY_DN29334_c0_g1_i1.p1 TRINITY_DN29334_c0_g1~~TRINITY_DN29334_c0_g1_i1.p1  ORF type:complete len:278 (+),score=89.10 TRINITY_DN29334_c0_g1_i1:83-835(+)